MIYWNKRPSQFGVFEYCVLAALHAKQLERGCLPRVDGKHKFVVTALLEIAAGKVARAESGEIQDFSHPLR